MGLRGGVDVWSQGGSGLDWRGGALRRGWVVTALALVFSLVGCSPGRSPGAAAGGPGQDRARVPLATIQEVMATQVDPSADSLWASVSTVITAAGTEEKQPDRKSVV